MSKQNKKQQEEVRHEEGLRQPDETKMGETPAKTSQDADNAAPLISSKDPLVGEPVEQKPTPAPTYIEADGKDAEPGKGDPA